MLSVTNCVALFFTFCILLFPTASVRINSYGYDVQCEQNSKIKRSDINSMAKESCILLLKENEGAPKSSRESVSGRVIPARRKKYKEYYNVPDVVSRGKRDFRLSLFVEWNPRTDTCTARGLFASRKFETARWKCEDIIPGRVPGSFPLRSQSTKPNRFLLNSNSPHSINFILTLTQTPQYNVKCWNEEVISKESIAAVATSGCRKIFQHEHGQPLKTHISDGSSRILPYTGVYFDKAKNLFMIKMPPKPGTFSSASYYVVTEWDNPHKKCIPHGVILESNGKAYSKCDELDSELKKTLKNSRL
ncbi:hypothetical protein GcC1_223039 [Golovinomyces cichoracearum]|uniref:Secreted effector protein n=1 Tax=Golovinomyces cichoracearum TaxID=62708 RepID=A0A420H6Z1_9PEZI|nr:hypothetical protein GcC1_223039 [Golovinomyces cichoracearum]